jgi:hypothetical protein
VTTLPTTAYVHFGPGGAAEVNSTVRLTGSSHIQCCVYPDSAPVLVIDDAHVRMSVTVPDPGQVTTDDVTWGRLLAEAVGRYVAELERRAAATRDIGPDQDTAAGRAA